MMMNTLYRYTILVLLLVLANGLQAQGPWPQGKGNGYFKLSEWWIRFDEHYTDTGDKDPNLTTGVYNTSIYAEYGLTDRLTGVVNLPFFSRTTMNNLISETTGAVLVEGEALNGLGDAELGLKYTLTQDGAGLPIALSLTFGLPLGEDQGGSQGNLQLGDGEFNQLLMAHIGSSFQLGNANAYWSAILGVNNRTNNFSDELRYGLEAGVNLAQDRLLLVGRLRGLSSFMNGETAATATSTGLFANNIEFLTLGGEANFFLTEKLGLSLGLASPLSGRIYAVGTSYSAGVFLQIR
ncbi:MAG: hypothetical protein AAF433_20675 [Bacteroidota bacterium]